MKCAAALRRSRRPLAAGGCPLPVYVSEGIDTPCLFGPLHPCVYVTPAAAENETALRYSIEHELTHYRHGDHIWSVLRGACLALHWYELYQLLDRHCLTEGQVHGPEETRMWSDEYPDDQAYRNLYVMLAALNADGGYAEGLAEILKKQQNYDPETFAFCLQNLTQEQRGSIQTLIGMEP